MKTILLTSLSLLLLGSAVMAQKFAYVDTKYILLHMPEYAQAQGELNRLSSQWQEDIEAKYENVKRLEEAYEAEKVLLTEDMKKRRLEEIDQKKQEARDLQKQRFGVNGELFTQRETLIKPVQDQMYEGITEVASSRGYMVIFDKSSQSNMLYSNPKHDVSDEVLRKMGLTPGELIEQPGKGEGGKEDGGGKGGEGGKTGGGATSNPRDAKGGGGGTVPRGGKQ